MAADLTSFDQQTSGTHIVAIAAAASAERERVPSNVARRFVWHHLW